MSAESNSTKNITLDRETYNLLLRAKRPGETLSDVIRRELKPPPRISDLAGLLSDESMKTWMEIDQTRRLARRRDDNPRRKGGHPRSCQSR